MSYTFIRASANRKTGPIPQTYSARETCPPSCAHYGADCYGEDFYTRMQWDKVPARGVPANRIKRAQQLQNMIAAEAPEDQAQARQLIQRGRQEFQTTAKG
jgi:hypothetical protein